MISCFFFLFVFCSFKYIYGVKMKQSGGKIFRVIVNGQKFLIMNFVDMKRDVFFAME